MAGITCENLQKRYGSVCALDGVSFVVEPGTVVALLGANGSGKTTTVRILTTLTTPDSGSAHVAGLDVIREASLVRRMIGLTAQETVIDRFLDGTEYMHLIAQLRGVPRRERAHEVKALLAEFSLTEIAERRVGTYSGGMRRRLDLASSFIGEPSVLFLDEPSTGLDPHSRRSLWTAIRRRADIGRSVLITTQYMEEADALADLVVVLAHGRVIATGRADDLKNDIGGRLVELTFEHLLDREKAATILAELDVAAISNERGLQFILPTVQPTLQCEHGRGCDQQVSAPVWAAGLRGVPVGDRWRWSDPERRDEGETRWGVLWNRNLGEIVAVQLIGGGTGRVLLLGTIHREPDRAGILAWLEEMAREHMVRPDGLMALAWAIDALPANGREGSRSGLPGC